MEDGTLSARVILVRHGQSSYNIQQRIQGRCDESVLTEKGRNSAALVGKALKSISASALYCSPLQRARQTADIILAHLDNPPQLQSLDILREIDLPLWEEMLRQEVKEKFPEQYRCWKERPHELRMVLEGGKEHFPVLAIYEEARQFWQQILPQHQGETIIVVAHNGINRALLCTALGISPARYHSIQQSNCGISVLNFAGGLEDPVQLESMNLIVDAGEELPKPRAEHQGARLLLVRHGETDWNRQGRFQGQIDVPLNDHGRSQAQKAAEFLKVVKIDLAASSPLMRPKETAEIILQEHPGVNLQFYPDLSEISHGLWEGKFEAEIEQLYPGELEKWRTLPEEVQMPEGENLQEVWERAIASWNQIVASILPHQTALVVAHDAVNKAIVCYLLGLEPKDFWKIKQGNGAVTAIDYPQGVNKPPVLEAINITTHLSGSVFDSTAAGAL